MTACGHAACKTCVRRYLVTTAEEPHCMECRSAWGQDFLVAALNRSFVCNEYAKHRSRLLLERELSQIPATMPAAARRKALDVEVAAIAQLQDQIVTLNNRIESLRRQQYSHRVRCRAIREGREDGAESAEASSRRKFVMPCPAPDCRGFLSTQYKCEICHHFACPRCLAHIGPDKNAEHTCRDEDVKSAELIRKETKGCPGCGARISKTEGCDQMWCVECHTAFSWRTGRVQTGIIHNPHFYEYQRAQGRGEVVRAPGDMLCGGLCALRQLDPLIRQLGTRSKCGAALPQIHRAFAHISQVDLPTLRHRVVRTGDTEDLRVGYILNRISRDQLEKRAYRADVTSRKLAEQLRIYELLGVCGTEAFVRLVNLSRHTQGPSEAGNTVVGQLRRGSLESDVAKELADLDALRRYCNDQFGQISITYNQSAPYIEEDWKLRLKKRAMRPRTAKAARAAQAPEEPLRAT